MVLGQIQPNLTSKALCPGPAMAEEAVDPSSKEKIQSRISPEGPRSTTKGGASERTRW